MPRTEEQKAARRIYEEKNKEKIAERTKAYCLKNEERLKKRRKEYNANNKDKSEAYYQENKEHITKVHLIYREKNEEKTKIYRKEYQKTPSCKKSKRIWKWKSRGVICDDFNELYEKYINTKNCELCEVVLTEDKTTTTTTKCLDHDHESNLFRNIVCWNCNLHILPKQTIIGEI